MLEVGDGGIVCVWSAVAERAARWHCNASCWECKSRYFCSVKARSGDLRHGLSWRGIFAGLLLMAVVAEDCVFIRVIWRCRNLSEDMDVPSGIIYRSLFG